jgi:aminopeptidase-like protein
MRTFPLAPAAALVLVLAVPGAAEEKPLAPPGLIEALTLEVSGEIAFDYTVRISQFDRIQASKGWHAAAQWIKGELERIGYADALIEGWPSNGSRYTYTYRTPIGWDAQEAELWMTSPREERLCRFEEVPLSLVKHSHSADVQAELVDVGTGIGEESYRGKDVKGRIVLATAYTGDVMREAVLQRGAVGVITWYPPEVRPGYPDMIRYTALWPTWEERERMGFGFNVSKRQGWELKRMLDEGRRVVLHAKVRADYYDGPIEVLSASLPGARQPEQEVLIIGHLCHPRPSANDNASGSGGMLEMARALKAMVDRGLIEPPRRTVRFLWVPEFSGTVPYIRAHLNRTRNTLSVINCDMIGENLHLTGGLFTITRTPDSLPSYLNDVTENFARLVQSLELTSLSGSRHPFALQVNPFSGGSDHVIFNDGALKVPAVMFGHGDTFHHTSLDTPDKVDASELRRVCTIALGASYYLAHAGDDEAAAMARLIARNGLGRLAADAYDAMADMEGASDGPGLTDAYSRAANVLDHAARRETAAVLSARVFSTEDAADIEIRRQAALIRDLHDSLTREMQARHAGLCERMSVEPRPVGPPMDRGELDGLVPMRVEAFVCPLQSDFILNRLGEEALAAIDNLGDAAYETLNFADGRRSVAAIARAVSAEHGRTVPAADVLEFFEVLERAELIRILRR